MQASFTICTDSPVEYCDLAVDELFVDGETERAAIYLNGTNYAKNMITGINRVFDNDHIVCRVKFDCVNPQA